MWTFQESQAIKVSMSVFASDAEVQGIWNIGIMFIRRVDEEVHKVCIWNAHLATGINSSFILRVETSQNTSNFSYR